jgi:hypothetical protein
MQYDHPSDKGKVGKSIPKRIYLYAGKLLALLAGVLTVPAGTAHAAGARRGGAAGPQPEIHIPVGPLGYTVPGELPSLYAYALVELYYIDATHLLFVFNRHGLIRRDNSCPLPNAEQRVVRAVVLELPTGKVIRQADWNLYDLNNYLWSLNDGSFLMLRCTKLERVDATLTPKPLIAAAGKIDDITFAPDHSLMSVEEEPPTVAPSAKAKLHPEPPPLRPISVQFIGLQPLRVVARTRVQTPSDIPLMNSGILEPLPGKSPRWLYTLFPFTGAPRRVVSVTSYCRPQTVPLAPAIFLSMLCPTPQTLEYDGYNLQGGHMWRMSFDQTHLLPEYLLSRDNSLFGIETLHLTRPIEGIGSLTKDDVDGQVLDIFNTSTGKPMGELQFTPIYTGGRNADFSPDGTRVAILRNGAIEIYRLSDLRR